MCTAEAEEETYLSTYKYTCLSMRSGKSWGDIGVFQCTQGFYILRPLAMAIGYRSEQPSFVMSSIICLTIQLQKELKQQLTTVTDDLQGNGSVGECAIGCDKHIPGPIAV
jgi:hypothetical protein